MPKITKPCLHLLKVCRKKPWPLFFRTRCITTKKLTIAIMVVNREQFKLTDFGAKNRMNRVLIILYARSKV